jgi:antagonist of KipI
MALILEQTGTLALIVDLGRHHHRSLGVPVGGAADTAALALGNALVGNPPNTPALEFTLAGPTLRATADHGVVIAGAEFAVDVNGVPQAIGHTFTLRAGDRLTIGQARQGLRGYLCVAGGLDVPKSLGSRSAWSPCVRGQEIACPAGHVARRYLPATAWSTGWPGTLRVVLGTHAPKNPSWFAQRFTVLPASNRMGIRLSAAVPAERTIEELVSAPIAIGTVQLPPDDQPIILGVDAQTMGGYPRAAHVVRADWDRLAQLRPGDHLHFEPIELESARELWRRERTRLRTWVMRALIANGMGVHDQETWFRESRDDTTGKASPPP